MLTRAPLTRTVTEQGACASHHRPGFQSNTACGQVCLVLTSQHGHPNHYQAVTAKPSAGGPAGNIVSVQATVVTDRSTNSKSSGGRPQSQGTGSVDLLRPQPDDLQMCSLNGGPPAIQRTLDALHSQYPQEFESMIAETPQFASRQQLRDFVQDVDILGGAVIVLTVWEVDSDDAKGVHINGCSVRVHHYAGYGLLQSDNLPNAEQPFTVKYPDVARSSQKVSKKKGHKLKPAVWSSTDSESGEDGIHMLRVEHQGYLWNCFVCRRDGEIYRDLKSALDDCTRGRFTHDHGQSITVSKCWSISLKMRGLPEPTVDSEQYQQRTHKRRIKDRNRGPGNLNDEDDTYKPGSSQVGRSSSRPRKVPGNPGSAPAAGCGVASPRRSVRESAHKAKASISKHIGLELHGESSTGAGAPPSRLRVGRKLNFDPAACDDLASEAPMSTVFSDQSQDIWSDVNVDIDCFVMKDIPLRGSHLDSDDLFTSCNYFPKSREANKNLWVFLGNNRLYSIQVDDVEGRQNLIKALKDVFREYSGGTQLIHGLNAPWKHGQRYHLLFSSIVSIPGRVFVEACLRQGIHHYTMSTFGQKVPITFALKAPEYQIPTACLENLPNVDDYHRGTQPDSGSEDQGESSPPQAPAMQEVDIAFTVKPLEFLLNNSNEDETGLPIKRDGKSSNCSGCMRNDPNSSCCFAAYNHDDNPCRHNLNHLGVVLVGGIADELGKICVTHPLLSDAGFSPDEKPYGSFSIKALNVTDQGDTNWPAGTRYFSVEIANGQDGASRGRAHVQDIMMYSPVVHLVRLASKWHNIVNRKTDRYTYQTSRRHAENIIRGISNMIQDIDEAITRAVSTLMIRHSIRVQLFKHLVPLAAH